MTKKINLNTKYYLMLLVITAIAILFVNLTAIAQTAKQEMVSTSGESVTAVRYKTVKIDNLDIFYREAGNPNKPAILLLHGFPTSSHMFRNLMPKLAKDFYVIAPDYPGYGYSSMPKVSEYDYTFENLSNVVE